MNHGGSLSYSIYENVWNVWLSWDREASKPIGIPRWIFQAKWLPGLCLLSLWCQEVANCFILMLPWKFFEPDREQTGGLQIICPALESWEKWSFSLLRTSRNTTKSEETLLCRGRPTDGPLGLGLLSVPCLPHSPCSLCASEPKAIRICECESY